MPHHIPQRRADAETLSNDSFGYAVYSFVLMADQKQIAAVQALRDSVRNQRSMLPAHVTAKGPICDIPSIEEVQQIIDGVTAETPALDVKFAEPPRHRKKANGDVFATIAIEVTPELAELHERLLSALDPVSATAYGLDMSGEFHPHLTVYDEPLPELEQFGEESLKNLHIGDGFHAAELHLVGHAGTPFRGEWKLISTHRLNG